MNRKTKDKSVVLESIYLCLYLLKHIVRLVPLLSDMLSKKK